MNTTEQPDNQNNQTFQIPERILAEYQTRPSNREGLPGSGEDTGYIEGTATEAFQESPNTTHAEVFEIQQVQEPTEQVPTEQVPTELDEIREYLGSLVAHNQEPTTNETSSSITEQKISGGLPGHEVDHTEEAVADRAADIGNELDGLRDNSLGVRS